MHAKILNVLLFLVSSVLLIGGILTAMAPWVPDASGIPADSRWPLTITGFVSAGCGVILAITSAIIALRIARHSRTP